MGTVNRSPGLKPNSRPMKSLVFGKLPRSFPHSAKFENRRSRSAPCFCDIKIQKIREGGFMFFHLVSGRAGTRPFFSWLWLSTLLFPKSQLTILPWHCPAFLWNVLPWDLWRTISASTWHLGGHIKSTLLICLLSTYFSCSKSKI